MDKLTGIELLTALSTPTIVISHNSLSVDGGLLQHILFQNEAFEDHHLKELAGIDIVSSLNLRQSSLRTTHNISWSLTYIRDVVILSRQHCHCEISAQVIPEGLFLSDKDFYQVSVPGIGVEEQRQFVDLFLNFDWASTPLGPRQTWDPLLRALVDGIICSPYPRSIAWGEKMTII